jgi:hypothetical protein
MKIHYLADGAHQFQPAPQLGKVEILIRDPEEVLSPCYFRHRQEEPGVGVVDLLLKPRLLRDEEAQHHAATRLDVAPGVVVVVVSGRHARSPRPDELVRGPRPGLALRARDELVQLDDALEHPATNTIEKHPPSVKSMRRITSNV